MTFTEMLDYREHCARNVADLEDRVQVDHGNIYEELQDALNELEEISRDIDTRITYIETKLGILK